MSLPEQSALHRGWEGAVGVAPCGIPSDISGGMDITPSCIWRFKPHASPSALTLSPSTLLGLKARLEFAHVGRVSPNHPLDFEKIRVISGCG